MTMLCVEVAQTIIKQLGGQGRLKAMIGVKGYAVLASTEKIRGGVAITIPAFGRPRINVIEIRLNGKDLYDLKFYFVRAGVPKLVDSAEDVYCDQLIPVVEKATGLYLSMGRVA